jgi:microcystin degradation protein MlrC
MTRVGIAGLWHETNTYSARLATRRSFEEFELLSGEAVRTRHAGTRTVMGGFIDGCAGRQDVVPLFSAGAWPAGPAPREIADELLGRLRDELAAAGQLDGLLLNLHGAMVGGGHPDMERDVVHEVRSVVGDTPVVAVLDLHGNPSLEFVAGCDAVIAYDTYPHVDMWERGREAARLLATVLAGRRLRSHVAKLPLLTSPLAQGSEQPPMRDLLGLAAAARGRPGIARVSLLPGFAYSDVQRAGFSVLVVADDGADNEAHVVLDELTAAVEARAEGFAVSRPSPAEAVRRAAAAPARPVVLADVADNIGGGSAGDGTALLAELLAQQVDGAVMAIADPQVARMAARLGAGASIGVEVGGKTDDLHGEPVPISGVVERVSDGRYRTSGTWMTGREFSMGTTVVIRCHELRLVVMERVTPPFHREQLTSLGIDPAACSVIVAKGAIAWRSAFGDIARVVIEVDTPGVCPIDPRALPRTTAPVRARSTPSYSRPRSRSADRPR